MTSTNHAWPRCPECGGKVELSAKPGRTREYRRGVHMPIPDDFEIPTCTRCGEELSALEITEPLDELLGAQYRAQVQRELEISVGELEARHGVSQRDIEDACGVTRTYLSHLLAGRKEPSVAFMKLIRSFVISPDAFVHARSQEPVTEYLAGLFELRKREAPRPMAKGEFLRVVDQPYRSPKQWGPGKRDAMKRSA